MGVIWRKVWFDLWHNKVRTVLVILSVGTGVFSVGAIFGMNDQMLPAMDASQRSTLAPHMTIYLNQNIDRDTALALEDVPGVAEVEPNNEISIRYKLRPHDDWKKGALLMRDDYENQKFDLVQLRAGAWPKGDNLGIERMHAEYYGIDLGDKVIFDVDGQERAFTVTGKIRHPFVPPPSMYDLAFFFADAQLMERFGVPEGTFSNLEVRVTPYSSEHAHEVATLIKDRLAKEGVSVVATVYQDPDKHWGRPFMEGFTVVLQFLAIVSLVLSGVLVLNTLTAIITQQTNQIGILKAIGAGRGTIIGIYLSSVLVYGLLSLGVSLPLGMGSAYAVTRAFLGLFNIDYNVFVFSRRAVTLQVLAALVVPLVAALAPVLQGASITVRQAIAAYGLGGDFGSNWFDRAVERVGLRLLPPRYAMVVTNTLRRKGRLILTQLVLVIAGVMFLMVMSLNSSIDATLDGEFNRRSYDVVVQFENPQRIEAATRLAETADGVDKAGMWMTVPVTLLHEDQSSSAAGVGSELEGVPLDDPMYAPRIVAGRWLEPGDQDVVVVNRDTAEDEHIQVGDVLTLDLGVWGKHDWTVVGLYQTYVMFGGGFSLDAMYTPRTTLLRVMHRGPKTSLMFVRTTRHSPAETDAIGNQLEDLFGGKNMKVDAWETLNSSRQTADASFATVTVMLLVLAVIMAVVGGIGLMGSLSISVVERTKEIGVLRAIGARSGAILSMFVLEGVMQGVLAWLIAAPIAVVVAPFLSNLLGQTMFNTQMDYRFNTQAVLIWLVVILVVSTLASILPARSATRISVRQSLAYE
jgi:putative ABC transport system permease protein